ncbi:MAG: type II secretion system major pseudopilin GspG [Pirellulaceae bacterium]
MNHRKRNDQRGFTLVEVMIVLAILVLLIAMVGPRLLSQQDKADKQLTLTQINSIEEALKFYKVDNRTYPSTEEGLASLLTKPTDEARGRNWDGPYLEENTVPVDAWGNQIQYQYPGTRGSADSPDIWSLGPDGQDNTEDDITNWTGSDSSEGGATTPDNTGGGANN